MLNPKHQSIIRDDRRRCLIRNYKTHRKEHVFKIKGFFLVSKISKNKHKELQGRTAHGSTSQIKKNKTKLEFQLKILLGNPFSTFWNHKEK